MGKTQFSKRGSTGVPYGLIVGLIAITALFAVTGAGDAIKELFSDTSDTMGNVVSGANDALPAPSASPSPSPGGFDFPDVPVAGATQLVASVILPIDGHGGEPVSISGQGNPQVRICADGSCASANWGSGGTIQEGEYLQLRLTSAASANTTHTATVTIGAASDSWSVTTTQTSGEVLDMSGQWHPVRFVKCRSDGGTCNEAEAKAACQSVTGTLVTHAGSSSSTVFSMGASNSCHHTTGYFRTSDDSVVGSGNCLIAMSNVDWSGCCGTSSWHGYTVPFQPSSAGEWGYYGTGSNSGYNSGYNNISGGTGWGCQAETSNASTLGACSGNHYVACASSGADITPDSFAFDDHLGGAPGQIVESNILAVSGYEAPVVVAATQNGLEYRICADSGCSSVIADYTSTQGAITPGQYIQLQGPTPSSNGVTNFSISIGGISGVWAVFEGVPHATVETVTGDVHQVDFVLCGTGSPGSCTENVAKTACTNHGGQLVTHAGSTSSSVFSLGAGNSCHHTTGYYRTIDDSVVSSGRCLVAMSNVDWSSCCGTSSWHGYTMPIQSSSTGVWGYYGSTANSGYQEGYGTNISGSGWGCTSEGSAANNYSGCTSQYVACKM